MIQKVVYLVQVTTVLHQIGELEYFKTGEDTGKKVFYAVLWLMTITILCLQGAAHKKSINYVYPAMHLTLYRLLIPLIDFEQKSLTQTPFQLALFLYLQINGVLTLLICIILVSRLSVTIVTFVIAEAVFAFSLV